MLLSPSGFPPGKPPPQRSFALNLSFLRKKSNTRLCGALTDETCPHTGRSGGRHSPPQKCKWKMEFAGVATFTFRIGKDSPIFVSQLKSSFAADSLPCGFPFWPPQDIWVRKERGYLRTADRYSLLVQRKHSLSHLSTLLHHSLFPSFSTILQVLSRDLSTFVREATCKEFFPYAKLMRKMAEWEWACLSIKNSLKCRSNRRKIAFRCWRSASDMRRTPAHPIHSQALHQSLWFDGHKLKWRKIEGVANLEQIIQRWQTLPVSPVAKQHVWDTCDTTKLPRASHCFHTRINSD